MTLDALRDTAVDAVLAVMDDPLGFDPTRDMLVPTPQDEAERLVNAVLELVWVARRHELSETGPRSPGIWYARCSCRHDSLAGTVTHAERKQHDHLRAMLEAARQTAN